MKCPHCEAQNPEGVRFCGFCGQPVDAASCASCGAENPPGFRFCGHCGAALAGTDGDGAGERAGDVDVQRRQLTILFSDLVGSTELSVALDPEELRELIRSYQQVCTGIIERYGGVVTRYMGDGILAHFGYPRAHENDPERAVHAGLGIVEAVRAIEPARHGARVGIATGPVVVGDLIGEGASEERAVVGHTPNLAARLQALGEADSVVVAPRTRQLVEGLFEFRDLGERRLKGIPEPVRVSLVLGVTRVEMRFDAARARALAPILGRTEELESLQRLWGRAKSGSGRVAVLVGAAGIGKSRIVRALRERLGGDRHLRLLFQCSPYQTNTAFYPFIDRLARAARIERRDAPQVKVEKLRRLIAPTARDADADLGLFANLLSIPAPGGPPGSEQDAQRRKERIMALLVEHVCALSAQSPVLAVFEDVHWMDPTSEEVLARMVEGVGRASVLVLMTSRPGFSVSWREAPHVRWMELNRLDREDCEKLVADVARGKALPQEVVTQIIDRTDGVPLFVEEFTKTMLDSGMLTEEGDRFALREPLRPIEIPETLQDSLRERLDKLNLAKQVVQLGAAIGREFSHELLAHLSPLAGRQLEKALEQLVASEIVYRKGETPRSTYVFKHVLLRDAAYDGMLRSRRRQLHEQIARVLESDFPETAQLNPEILAHHLTEAGEAGRAVAYWKRAGALASERSANVEAVEHLKKGLELLSSLPESPERDRQELEMQTTLGATLIYVKGPGSPEVERAYARARELDLRDASGDEAVQTLARFAALWGEWRICRGLSRRHVRLANQLLELALRAGDPDLIMQSHHAQWATTFFLGQLERCCEHVEQGVARYDSERHRGHAALYGGHDTAVCGHGQAGLARWLLGFPDRARDHTRTALELARTLDHAPSIAHAMDYELMRCLFVREPGAVLECADQVIRFAEERNFPDYRARGDTFRGWALGKLGDPRGGPEAVRAGVEAQRAVGTAEDLTVFLDMLAEGLADSGRVDDALAVVDETLGQADPEDVGHYWEAALHLRRGAVLALGGEAGEADAAPCFERSIAVARGQAARSLRLRAALALAALRRRQGRAEEAAAVLRPAYEWFREGLDTPDLLQARALLDRLP